MADTKDTREKRPAADQAPEASALQRTASPGALEAASKRLPGEPDVLLDVPELKLEELLIEVDKLEAQVALHAAISQLVTLDAGANVRLGRVKLTLKGVTARAQLKVRLDQVSTILDRALTSIDAHPEIVQGLSQQLAGTVQQGAEAAKGALASGQAVQPLLQQAGDATRGVLGEAGAIPRDQVKARGGGEESAPLEIGDSIPGLGDKKASPTARTTPESTAEKASQEPSRPVAGLEPGAPSAPTLIRGPEDFRERIFDGSIRSLGRWRRLGPLGVQWLDGEMVLEAGPALGLVYFATARFDAFRLELWFQPSSADARIAFAARFRDPLLPVPARENAAEEYHYEQPAYVAAHTGLVVQLGSQRPLVEPGTFAGVLTGDAAGAQQCPERAEAVPGEWNTLEVEARGDDFAVWLSGKQTARLTNVDTFRGRAASADPHCGFVGILVERGTAIIRSIEVSGRAFTSGEKRGRATALEGGTSSPEAPAPPA